MSFIIETSNDKARGLLINYRVDLVFVCRVRHSIVTCLIVSRVT